MQVLLLLCRNNKETKMTLKNIEIISDIAGIIFLYMLAEIGVEAFVIGFLLVIAAMVSVATEIVRTLKGE